MFDIFAMLLSSVATFLFPVFASYKALNTSDPALLKPWLMYWVVLACALLVESWFSWILVWIPLYPWLRAAFLLYLIAPQSQGARMLYETHLHPFLHEHEVAIDEFIGSAHARLRTAGLSYLNHIIDLLKEHVLGLPPKAQEASPPARMTYTQSLLARFNLPAAASNTTADVYSLLANAVSATTASSSATALNLVPPTMRGPERASFISAQRERLSFLLSALDSETAQLSPESPSPAGSIAEPRGLAENDRQLSAAELPELAKNTSETDFEKIDVTDDDIRRAKHAAPSSEARSSSGGGSWLPWSWGAKTPAASEEIVESEDIVDGAAKGESTAVDA